MHYKRHTHGLARPRRVWTKVAAGLLVTAPLLYVGGMVHGRYLEYQRMPQKVETFCLGNQYRAAAAFADRALLFAGVQLERMNPRDFLVDESACTGKRGPRFK